MGNNNARIALVQHLQRTQGNRAVQQLLRQPTERLPRPEAVVQTTVAPLAAIDQSADRRTIAPTIQRDAQGDAPWWKLASFGESLAWKMMGEFAPQLVPIVRKGPGGIIDWLEDRAAGAADAAFNRLMSPVRAITGTGAQLSAQFTPLAAALQDASAKIATNDCTPISQAANKIEQTAEKFVTPIIEKLQPVVAKVQGFLNAAWDKIGAPIWAWVKDYAGQQWDQVKQLASWIWQFSEPMRSLGQDAWIWLKNKIGMGDGPEGENGILQWLQGKFEAGWAQIKAALEPFSKQIGVVRAALGQVAETFTGPIGRIATLVSQAGKGISWLSAHLGKGSALAEARAYIEKSLIPPLIDGLHHTSAAVSGMAASVATALSKVAGGLDAAAGAVSGSALQFAASAVQWIAGEVNALAAWASQKLASAASWLASANGQLEHFLHGLAEFLGKVGGVVSNVWSLPAFLAEKVWNWIPACIRDPVIDFVMPIILRQVELFEELVRDNGAWQKTKVQVMGIIRQVFVNRDLMGAVKAAFNLILRVFNIPEEMLGKVAAKAAAAWDVVVKKPLDFIKNTARSLGHGFQLLWTNIGTHLEHGIEGWLFGELAEKNIKPPSSWTEPKPLFGFVVDVLGLNTSHLVELLKKRIDPKLVDKAQAWVGRFARAWDWITDVIDTSKSPPQNAQGLMGKAKDFGKTILTGAVEWVTGKVAAELATLAAAAAASGGLSEVIDVARRVYKAMVTAKRWAGRILQMASDTLDHVLDIASGNVSKVGAEFEKLMDRGMPVVIGFLADQVGLGGVGAAIRDIVNKLREQVDAAILWLIDKAKAGIEAVLGAVQSGVAAVKGWFGTRERFTAPDGPHQLYFVGSESAAKLVVASVETSVEELLAAGGKLETDTLASNDSGRIEALKAARGAYKDFVAAQKVAGTAGSEDTATIARIKSAVQSIRDSLALTGVGATDQGLGVKIAPRDEITLLSKESKTPTNTATVRSIDYPGKNLTCAVAQPTGNTTDLKKDLLDYQRTWRLYEEGDETKPQCHHKIPWENATFGHAEHPLAVTSKVDLYRDYRNKLMIRNHNKPHHAVYHKGVEDRMWAAWNALPKSVKLFDPKDTSDESKAQKQANDKTAASQAQKKANDKIGDVMEDIGNAIKNRKLQLYTDQVVTVTANNC